MSEASSTRPLGQPVASHSAPWPGKPILKGRFITLEPLSNSHTNSLFKELSGESNVYLYDYIPDNPPTDLETFRTSLDTKINSKETTFFAIIDSKTHKAIGYLSLMRIDTQNRCIEVGHVIFSARMQKSPGGTECMYLLARYVFEDLGYRRYEWKANSLNVRSRRAAERLGFTFEGIFRQHGIVKGRNRDTAWYSMLDGEWDVVKRGFERWLAEENFDEFGGQRVGLLALRAGGSGGSG